MMLRIPSLLTPDEVRDCRQALEQATWQDGRTTAGSLAVKVKSNLQLPIDSPIAARLGNLILDRLGRNPLFLSAALPLRVLPPRFNRYEGGGTYGNHIDNALFVIPGTAIKVRTDVSTTVFFSDPEEYEGGELIVEDTYGHQSVKLAAGDAIVYPGTSLHRVNPVTRGTRYASFFWTQSLVKSDEQRRLLFDLDQSIQQLSLDHPDHAKLSALSGTYHNLLRMWSEA
ncbi:Fe2+-dependent dioxygenase [Comamonas aquatica]|jgi:PKHD-type hydroxylase|uniref:Fe2+-dependent dioxygenase n=1 Tax=Comamonas aquatica TaxID=225991 RepID=A0AA42HT64_9BURK|nr:Fe2+-dependent dioxygenase [Comamonas aquatica]MDH0199735.1 Fe2+-dependent dioxygenase [Comamonas aquatica]MDH0364045.1 Fe2+-dependent dioxygenase [Comamonas aquatica]MDH0898540.1 Fe2+-dependent dioxygenase [Comamonas aquatica]MDH1378194.1 Fe2+-dependent dioxygenase [Comamonas aquatica]MDH1444936.1 Fe2+-dependent dioxygenase [Comamonas aquatica]